MREHVYRFLDDFEDRHWWYLARRQIVVQVLARALRERPAGAVPVRLLDVGCGTGGTLCALARLGEVVGLDTDQ